MKRAGDEEGRGCTEASRHPAGFMLTRAQQMTPPPSRKASLSLENIIAHLQTGGVCIVLLNASIYRNSFTGQCTLPCLKCP